jgi:membrane fusion protein (multidrug efflux system)
MRRRQFGHVENLAPASGQQFALLHPDTTPPGTSLRSSSISIKIAVDPDDPLAGQLRPGMSVAPMIDTKPPRDTVLSTLVRSKTGDHGLALNR